MWKRIIFFATILWLCNTTSSQLPDRPTPEKISAICGQPIGLSSNGKIPDSSITALSVFNGDFSNYGAHRARLHLKKWPPGYRADPGSTNNSWIKVDFGEPWVLTGIATQGYGDKTSKEWVTEYILMTSTGSDYSPIRAFNYSRMIFTGNNDSTSVKFNAIPLPVIATSLTLYPLKWHKNVGLRMELYGCKPGYHIQAMVAPLGFHFTKSYLDPSNVDYINLAMDIQNEIQYLLRDIPGFLSAKVIRFNPAWDLEVNRYHQTEAEVEIQCIENTTKYLETMLQIRVKQHKVFLNPKHLLFHHPLDKNDKCSSPSVKVNLSKTLTNVKRITTTNHLKIKANFNKLSCKVFRKTNMKWELSALNKEGNAFTRLEHESTDSDSITLKPHQFQPTLMFVRFVAYTEKIEISSYDYGLVQIDLPPLRANLTGPTKVRKGDGIVILDASKSYDPDISGKSKNETLTFTWFCKRDDDYTLAQYSARRRIQYRNRYRYTKFFMRSIPADIPCGRPFSDDGCFGFGPGRMSSKEAKFKVNVNRMKSKHKYIFTLVVTKGNRRAKLYHTLWLEPSVFLKVRCSKNCASGGKISRSKKTFLSTKCIGKECPTISSYKWILFRETRSFLNGSMWNKVKNIKPYTEGLLHRDHLIMTSLQNIGLTEKNVRLKVRAVVKLTVKNRAVARSKLLGGRVPPLPLPLLRLCKQNYSEIKITGGARAPIAPPLATALKNDDQIEEEDEIVLKLNNPPYSRSNQSCKISPKIGKAMSTMFHIDCGKWYDEDGVVFFEYRYRRSNNIVIISADWSSSVRARLPLGVERDNFSIPIEVRVHDLSGDYTKVNLQAKVQVLDYADLSEILHNIVEKKENELTIRSEKEARELSIAVLSLIDKYDKKGNQSDDLRQKLGVNQETAKKLKDEIINQISKHKVTNWQGATQVLTVVNLATDEEDETSDNVKKKALRMLDNVKNFIAWKIHNDSNMNELKFSLTINYIASIENLLRSFASSMRYFPDMSLLRKAQMKKSKEYTQDALRQLRSLGTHLLATKGMDENPTVLNSKSISFIISKNSPSMLRQLSGSPIQSGSREVKFPSLEAILDGKNGSQLLSVQSKIIMFSDNPFTWDKTSTYINSWAVDINLYDDKGDYLEISNLKKPVGIYVPEDSPSKLPTHQPNFVKPTENSSDASRMRYHSFNVLYSHSTAMIKIKPEKDKKFQVFVSAGIRPTPWKYNFTRIIPDFSSCQKTVINGSDVYVNCTMDPYMFNISRKITGKTGNHFIGIRYLEFERKGAKRETDLHHRNRRGCGPGRRKKRSCVGVKDPPTAPIPTMVIIPDYNASTDANYTMSISLASCMYWSEKDQKWTDFGCKPGPATTKGTIQCLCNHLSAFGGDFFIEPNPIDFDKVLLTLKNPKVEDFIVMTTVMTIFILYFIGLLFARRADKKDELKAIPNVYISDQGDNLYEISVFTGLWKGQGTTANVGIILYGENGYTDPINLNDSTLNKLFFARGSINTFLLYLPKGLGPLYKIKIWHDNSGDSPAWFLRQVVITDKKEETEWHFLANKWIALEKGDGEIETEIRVAEQKEIQEFRNVFHSRASQSLADSHLWASVFMRPPQTSFTRVQRLSCCLSIIFATMVTNAMFYQFGSAIHDTFQIGPLKVSWTQVKIGIQSALIAIPVNAIIVTIFRNARPKDEAHDDYVRVSDENLRGQSRKKGLPHFFIYIGWLLCLGTSIASAIVIILYSLSWGGDTANEWLTSILVSFVQDIFLTQPIKVLILASLLALLLKKPPNPEKARGSPHWKNKIKYKKFLPPKGEELEAARMARKKLLKTARMFMEICTYVFFAILLFIICYGNRKSSRFLMKDEMVHMMKGYNKVQNMSAFWNWTEHRLIPGLYNATWYNGKDFGYEEGFVSNREAFLVGMPRLRQLRIKKVPECPASPSHPILTHYSSRCIPKYSPKEEDKTQYHKSDWSPVPNASMFQSSFDLREECPIPWRYQDPTTLNTLSYRGTYSSYSGGGYVADLGYNNKSARDVVNTLIEKKWIDNRTAVVFIEFTVFEPASLLITAVKVLYERLPTGGIRPNIRVEPLTVYGGTDSQFRTIYQTCQLIFIGVVTFLFFCECFKVYKIGCRYFFRFWSWMDLILITCALFAMGTLFFKEKYVSDFIRGVHANPFQTTTTDFIVLWSQLEVYLLSFVIFIMTIKFLRLLRFNSHIGQLMQTLKHSTANLQSFYVVLCIILIAFTQMGMLIFGKNMESYSSFVGSLSIVLQKLLGTSMQLRKVQRVNKVIGSLFVFAYSLTVALLLLNVFLSILNTSYKEVREAGRKRRIHIALRKYIENYFKSCYRELLQELKLFGSKFRMLTKKSSMKRLSNASQDELWDLCSDARKEAKLPNGDVNYFSQDVVDNDIESYPYQVEYSAAEEGCEEEPYFEFVKNEHPALFRYLVPLATFDEEDDILDELSCLGDIKTSLRQIERDLMRATDEDGALSDDDNGMDMEHDTKSQESFRIGSTLSVTLSVLENEKPLHERVEKDDTSLYSVYSSEEGGVSDEEDEEGDNIYTAFNTKSGIASSLSSINELCAKIDQSSDPLLLSPNNAAVINPHTLRW